MINPTNPVKLTMVLDLSPCIDLISVEALKTLTHFNFGLDKLLACAVQFIIDTHDYGHEELITELNKYEHVKMFSGSLHTAVYRITSEDRGIDGKYIFEKGVEIIQVFIETYRYAFLTALRDLSQQELLSIYFVSMNVIPLSETELIAHVDLDYLPF